MDRLFAQGTVNAAQSGEGPPLFLFHSLLSDRASWLAAAVASGAAIATVALPLKLNVVVAIAAAIVAGLLIDHVTPREAKPVVEDAT